MLVSVRSREHSGILPLGFGWSDGCELVPTCISYIWPVFLNWKSDPVSCKCRSFDCMMTPTGLHHLLLRPGLWHLFAASWPRPSCPNVHSPLNPPPPPRICYSHHLQFLFRIQIFSWKASLTSQIWVMLRVYVRVIIRLLCNSVYFYLL